MYFGDPRRRGFPTVRFDGAAIESTAVNQTLTETKRLDTRQKYPKRCIVGRICADLGPDCSLFVKSTKFSGMTELIMTINM